MAFEEVEDHSAPSKQKKFKPFDLTITVSSMADLDFLRVMAARGKEMARGMGGFSSTVQGKAITLLESIDKTLADNAGV